MKRLLAALAFLALASFAHAEPYLALREGYKCTQCHVNRTGGGMRSSFGSIYSQTRLPTTVLGVKEEEGETSGTLDTASAGRFLRNGAFLDTALAERVAVGGDFRTRFTKTYAPEAKDDQTFDVQEGRVYVQFQLLPDVVSFYVDETLGPGAATSREIYALFEGLPLDGWVKAGKLLTPYGLRIPDDTSFIRETTGFNYNTPDNGVEVGIEPGIYSLAVAVQNGTAGGAEDNQAKQVSMVNSLVFDDFRVGGSIAYNPSSSNRRFVYGGFGGLQLGRVGVLGELDLIRDEDKSTGDVNRQLASFLETDVEVYRGVNLRWVYDFLDPNKSIGENQRTRISVGAQWFVSPFVELNLFVKFNDSVPQRPEERTDFLIGELHLFF